MPVQAILRVTAGCRERAAGIMFAVGGLFVAGGVGAADKPSPASLLCHSRYFEPLKTKAAVTSQ